MTSSKNPKSSTSTTFLRETIELVMKEGINECSKPQIQKQLQEVLCDPILEYCIKQLTPYYLLLVIIFIVLLIVIAILLAFIIFTYNDSSRLQ